MRKTGLCLMVMFCLTLLNPFLQQLRAKMSIFSPQEIISMSDYIVVGNIKKDLITTRKQNAEYTAIHSEVTISMESILKGDIYQKEIVLQYDSRTDKMLAYGVDFDFPKKGTKVMLLLKQGRSGIALTYANSICVINNNKVSLYKGTEFVGNWKTTDYEKTYQTFYDADVIY
jgi:hypothetical protein